VVAMKGVELARDQEAQQAQLARASDLGVDERLKDAGNARTFDELAGQIQFCTARRSSPHLCRGVRASAWSASQHQIGIPLRHRGNQAEEVGEHGDPLEPRCPRQFRQDECRC
jgi:hypothetical protein